MFRSSHLFSNRLIPLETMVTTSISTTTRTGALFISQAFPDASRLCNSCLALSGMVSSHHKPAGRAGVFIFESVFHGSPKRTGSLYAKATDLEQTYQKPV